MIAEDDNFLRGNSIHHMACRVSWVNQLTFLSTWGHKSYEGLRRHLAVVWFPLPATILFETSVLYTTGTPSVSFGRYDQAFTLMVFCISLQIPDLFTFHRKSC